MTFSEARKLPILEFRLPDILAAMELTMPQFVDLCILCGCDYTDTIRGIGPKNALKLIKTHGSIEKVLENLDTAKYPLPDSFDFVQVRRAVLSCLGVSETHSSSVVGHRALFAVPSRRESCSQIPR